MSTPVSPLQLRPPPPPPSYYGHRQCEYKCQLLLHLSSLYINLRSKTRGRSVGRQPRVCFCCVVKCTVHAGMVFFFSSSMCVCVCECLCVSIPRVALLHCLHCLMASLTPASNLATLLAPFAPGSSSSSRHDGTHAGSDPRNDASTPSSSPLWPHIDTGQWRKPSVSATCVEDV